MKDKKKKEDRRFISYNHDLEPGGLLQGLRDLLDANEDLQLCYRGNSGDEIVVYYNNHIMFKVKKYKNKYKNKQFLLTISFNHARYEKDWQEILDDLQKNHHFEKGGKKKIADEGDGGYLSCGFNNSDDIKWEDLYGLLKRLMDSFFAPANEKVIDYFKEGQPLVTKKKHLEKQWQQRIFFGNTNCDNGYFIYDMEFARPHEDKQAVKNDKNNNEPDMLAIKYENHKPVKLVFIEVKSTVKACTNPKSGACEHIRKTAGALDDFFKTRKDEYVETRKGDAEKIIEGYASIKLHGLNEKPELDFKKIDMDIEILMVFTDEAVEWARKNVVDMKKAAAPYPEKLAFATVDAVDEKGKILPLLLDQQTKN